MDFGDCDFVEVVPGKHGGVPLVKGTRIPAAHGAFSRTNSVVAYKIPSAVCLSSGEENTQAAHEGHENTPHRIYADAAKEGCEVERGSVADG